MPFFCLFHIYQLLKNIQVLMDASVALMNQYAMISAQFPPLQTNPIPSNSTSSTSPTTSTDETKTTTTTTASESVDKETTVAVEEKKTIISDASDDGAGPSTSQKSSSIETVEIDGNIVTIEDIGENDPSETSDAISEVRRRRLERFEAKNQES